MNKTVVVTHPISAAYVVPLSHVINILRELPSDISLITGNEGWRAFQNASDIEVQGIMVKRSIQPHRRIISFLRTQLWISFAILRTAKGADRVIFLSGGDYLIAPILTSRILKKKTILMLAGSSHRMMRSSADSFSNIIQMMAQATYVLSSQILTYSQSSIAELELERFKKKVTFCHHHFIRALEVNEKEFDERDNIIGFVGRLVPEKGVMNLIKAIPSLLAAERTLKVMVLGEGALRDEIMEYSEKNLPPGILELTGWIDHKDLPHFLAKMKLIILPSYTEGLPNIVLEGMACGTPALATMVGSIPDIIKDGHNGFIMKGNDPKTIADEVIRALRDPDLSLISENAKRYVMEEYGFEKTLAIWRQVLND